MSLPMDAVLVRPARRDDWAGWRRLWADYHANGRTEEPSLPEAVTGVTWDRFFQEHEPMEALLAEVKGATMGDKGAPSSMIETQLRAWAAELDRLKASAEKQLSEAKAEYYEHIGELRDDIEAQLKKWGKEIESFEPRPSAQDVVQELRRSIQAELSALEPEIEALKAKAGKAEAEAKKLIDELKARRKVLKEKLSELKHASGGAWEDVKTGATRAWDELRPALQSAISKFK